MHWLRKITPEKISYTLFNVKKHVTSVFLHSFGLFDFNQFYRAEDSISVNIIKFKL